MSSLMATVNENRKITSAQVCVDYLNVKDNIILRELSSPIELYNLLNDIW